MTRQRIMQAGLIILPVIVTAATMTVLLLILRATNSSVDAGPLDVLEAFWKGSFRNTRTFARVIEFWLPLTLVSMGLVLTFRAGLWNIGVEGQMVLGGLFASWAAFTLEDVQSSLLVIPVTIIAAMVGGALWAAVVGVLKTRFAVHEIFSGVALNFIAVQISLQLMAVNWKPAESDKAQYSRPFSDAAMWPGISRQFNVSLMAIIITLVTIVVVVVALNRTRWGLNIKATGRNPRSALLLGVPTGFTSMSALMLCGALAGIGGAHRLLFTHGKVVQQFAGGIGFLGLLVVLLAGMRGILVPFIALIFSVILAGSTQLQFLSIDTSLTGVIQGTLVLFVLLFNGLQDRMNRNSRTAAPQESKTDG